MKKDLKLLFAWGWKYMRPFLLSIIVYNLIGFIASASILVEPEISRLLIDSMSDPNRRAFFIYLGFIVILQLINLFLSQLAKIIRVQQDMIMNRTIETNITRVYLNRKSIKDKGHTVTLFKQDLPVMLQLYKSVIPSLIINGIFFLFVAVRLFFINYIMLIASLLFAIIPVIVVKRTGIRLSESNKRQTIIQDRYNGFVLNLPSASLDSQSTESCDLFLGELNKILSSSFNELWIYNRVQILSTVCLTIISTLGMFVIYVILGHMIFAQGFTYGQLFSVIMYTGILTTKINSVISSYQSIITSQYSLERVHDFLIDENSKAVEFNIESEDRSIEINNLTFSYEVGSIVLDSFDIKIEFPSLVLLKGSNGSGKSTLINILSGIIPLNGNSGKIIYHGFEPNDVYTIFQSSRIYPFSLRDNIFMGLPLGKKMKSKFCFCIPEFDMDHVCDEVSSGQAQKIIFQRMLAQNKEILLIDEPDSSVDKKGKMKIRKILEEMKNDHIIIVAVHHEVYDDIADDIINLNKKELL